MTLHHASSVEYNGKGIIIFGASGSGKSDLALRLIDAGAKLISDDYVEVFRKDDALFVQAAPNITGMIEVRGVGIEKIPYKNSAILDLALELMPRDKIERLPEVRFFNEDECKIPLYQFDGFSSSALAKIRLILQRLHNE